MIAAKLSGNSHASHMICSQFDFQEAMHEGNMGIGTYSMLLANRDANDISERGKNVHYDDSEGGLCVPVERATRCNVNRIPSITEVPAFLQLDAWGTRWNAFYTTGFTTGLRPSELCRLTYHMILEDPHQLVIIDGEEMPKWVGIVYPVSKAKPSGIPGVKSKQKWNRKDEREGHIPPGALLALQTYWYREGCKPGIIFRNCYSQYGKAWSVRRKKMIAMGFSRWARTENDYFPSGWAKKYPRYDIDPYSMRRFHHTCFHWLVSAVHGVPDIRRTQKVMAHSGYKDTQVYVHEYYELGIKQSQIGSGWNVLVKHIQGLGQMKLNHYFTTGK